MGEDARAEKKVSVKSSNILIIDDEQENLEAYQTFLENNGFNTKTIITESEAMPIMADWNFDAVIIDLRSPTQAVIDLAEKIKKSSPFCCVFLLTDNLAPAFIKKALNVGVESCLIKPFLSTILLESVKKGVERICLARENERLEKELSALKKECRVFKESYEQTKDMLTHDPLTGTLKWDYLVEILEYEIKRAKRHERWLSLLIFHLIAEDNPNKNKDGILKHSAAFLVKNIRSVDVLGRYGDGFAVILPETHEKGAWALGQRLKDRIAEFFTTPDEGGKNDNGITPFGLQEKVTLAVSTYPIDSHLPKKLIRIAESRLHATSVT